MANTCPRCHKALEHQARVCRHCLHVLDREGWKHDAGRLGTDGRGGGRELEDPPVGPIPIEGSGLVSGHSDAAMAGGAANGMFRLLTGRMLARVRRRDEPID
jgi:hypothetical protein